MHEFGIAQGLLSTVLAKADENRATQIDLITLELGMVSGVEEDALQFAFGALSEGTKAQHAQLQINNVPLRCFCEQCQAIFECRPFVYKCPTCGKASHDVRSGKELNLIAMEVT
jgi:hydrogenase nickel incorporation protein HypA/HybF